MSDEDVIDRFVGDYVSGDDWGSSSQANDPWFPPPGVRLRFERDKDAAGKPIAKVKVIDGGTWSPQVQTKVQDAQYRVDGRERLTASMTLGSVSITEVIAMIPNAQRRMVHLLDFHDGEVGFWICPSQA